MFPPVVAVEVTRGFLEGSLCSPIFVGRVLRVNIRVFWCWRRATPTDELLAANLRAAAAARPEGE